MQEIEQRIYLAATYDTKGEEAGICGSCCAATASWW